MSWLTENIDKYTICRRKNCKHDMIENREILRAAGTIALYYGD